MLERWRRGGHAASVGAGRRELAAVEGQLGHATLGRCGAALVWQPIDAAIGSEGALQTDAGQQTTGALAQRVGDVGGRQDAIKGVARAGAAHGPILERGQHPWQLVLASSRPGVRWRWPERDQHNL